MSQKSSKQTALSMQEVMDYLNSQTRPLTKKEICREFGIKGDDRKQLRLILKQMKEKSLIKSPTRSKKFQLADTLPERLLVEITGFDSMGDLIARPYEWAPDSKSPQIIVASDKLSPPAGIGDVAQALLRNQGQGIYQATLIHRITSPHGQMVCSVQEGRALPVDKRLKQLFDLVGVPKNISLIDGDLILVNLPPVQSHTAEATFVKRIGRMDDAFMPTDMAIYLHHLTTGFKEQSEKQAEKATVPPVDKNRIDLRQIPFVTIDGADARDFDDAVWAEPFAQGGWHIMIGIADVAWYVRSETALDSDARLKGNSVYFPDRVLPMLPKALSNGVCSLNPNQPRAAIVCEVWIDNQGHKTKHTFHRALIQSVRRLTYDEVQDCMDKKQKIAGLETEIANLTGAYQALMRYRKERGVLEIDVPERQVILNTKGGIKSITWRKQQPSMQLIEELMILANVAAAETLESKNMPTMYRIHDKPSIEKLESLSQFLMGIGQKSHFSENPEPVDFNSILSHAKGTKRAPAINEQVLRTQSQALYSPENIGHYGLALTRYAHFTSPIRRYADIMVHRALIKALKLGEGALTDEEMTEFDNIAQHISHTERQAAAAELEASDRYLTLFMKNQVGKTFKGRISSITPFGMFITLENSGAEGFIPLRLMTGDFYEYDADKKILTGRATGKKYVIGDLVRAILKECNPIINSMLFGLLNS